MKLIGVFLIILGILALAVLYLLHFTMVNSLLLCPLLIIVTGVMVYVWGIKREGLY
jgi:hypothetical protein